MKSKIQVAKNVEAAVLPYAAKTCGHFNSGNKMCRVPVHCFRVVQPPRTSQKYFTPNMRLFKSTSLPICVPTISVRPMPLVPTRGDFAATSLRDIQNCPGRPNDQYFVGKPKGTAERKIKYRDMSACAVCASLRWPSHTKLHTSKFANHKVHTSKFQIAHFQMSNCKCTRDTTKSLIVQRSFINLCTSVRRFVISHPDNILLR